MGKALERVLSGKSQDESPSDLITDLVGILERVERYATDQLREEGNGAYADVSRLRAIKRVCHNAGLELKAHRSAC